MMNPLAWLRRLYGGDIKTSLTVAGTGTLGQVNRVSSWMLWMIVGVMLSLVLWAYFTEVETVARSQGKVIPSAKLQVVQNYEGGVVSAIHVRSGQEVKQGDLLISLNEMQFDGDLQSRRQQMASLGARLARLTAESTGSAPAFSPALQKDAREFVDLEQVAYLSRSNQMRSQLEMLQAQIDQKSQELAEMRIALVTATKTMELSREERVIMAMLVEKGLEPKLELVRLDRTLADAQGRQDTARAAIQRLQAAIEEARARKDSTQGQFRAEARVDANKTLSELRSLQETMPALADKKVRAEVRSPVAGVVNRVLVSTVGGVAKPGEPLVEVVPADDQLVLEAQLLPSDIGFVKTGQTARIKLSAYDYSIFGAMEGRVTQVGADAVTNERGESFFIARIETRAPNFEVRGKQLPVMAGMQAQIDIVTGKRTIWDYLAKPLVAVRENAFKER
ncbi:MAG: HlyD family type I secretion periplasmic adaptor subunit [Ramlibacter sp.]|uniref:HlyD family type I secretion periplasmic adaptor subunit n=1 Tax=Ramlibacter sp. TaxID=1917967 RepID=UPI002638C6EB|nr:HlyD family type I secretion periplasmic adaptor subunit [Ramlibacter sp.]MDH4377552.1 HlyD family type I secretion periplasmic adaptor subunit [Ramlibacter sp.]